MNTARYTYTTNYQVGTTNYSYFHLNCDICLRNTFFFKVLFNITRDYSLLRADGKTEFGREHYMFACQQCINLFFLRKIV